MSKISILFLFILAIVAISCEPIIGTEGEGKYHQFTPEDLSFLYYNEDSLDFNGGFTYRDTVTFLANNVDTIRVEVQTKFWSYIEAITYSSKANLIGESFLPFPENSGFSWAHIDICRTSDYGDSKKYMDIGIPLGKGYDKYVTPIFDSALVLGKLYKDVYKIYPSPLDSTGINLIYFAKKYGFIKIERTDGRKLELIKIQNKEFLDTLSVSEKVLIF